MSSRQDPEEGHRGSFYHEAEVMERLGIWRETLRSLAKRGIYRAYAYHDERGRPGDDLYFEQRQIDRSLKQVPPADIRMTNSEHFDSSWISVTRAAKEIGLKSRYPLERWMETGEVTWCWRGKTGEGVRDVLLGTVLRRWRSHGSDIAARKKRNH